ncbi:MAG: hypothetical protein WAM17_01510 [Rhodoplanes sp.]
MSALRSDLAQMRQMVAIAIARLANAPHETIPGLKRRYYYRGNFVLLEWLSQKGLDTSVASLRKRGEGAHADRLIEAWTAARQDGRAP